MTVNLKRIASELNLAISTVSRALQDSHQIGAKTKQKVAALAEELKYKPNPNASGLRSQKSKTIAVVIPEIDNNFFALVIDGIEQIAQMMGYHVLIYFTHDDLNREISVTRYLLSGRVDGVLMSMSNQTTKIDHLVEFYKKKIPLVFFDRVCDDIDTAKITTDDYNSGVKATEHLIQRGCRRIAYLQVSETLSIGKKRVAGYIDALIGGGIPVDQQLILTCGNNDDHNYTLIRNLLLSKYRPDGIFASVEKLAISCYYVCNDINLTIPKQLKVIGFSNLSTASLLCPSLTTITQPAFEIGKEAATILFKMFKCEDNSYNCDVMLNSTLVSRKSTAID
jgi:LacI family transcriptional regulator